MTKNKETLREAADRVRRLAEQSQNPKAAKALRQYAAELDRRADRAEAAAASRRQLKELGET